MYTHLVHAKLKHTGSAIRWPDGGKDPLEGAKHGLKVTSVALNIARADLHDAWRVFLPQCILSMDHTRHIASTPQHVPQLAPLNESLRLLQSDLLDPNVRIGSHRVAVRRRSDRLRLSLGGFHDELGGSNTTRLREEHLLTKQRKGSTRSDTSGTAILGSSPTLFVFKGPVGRATTSRFANRQQGMAPPRTNLGIRKTSRTSPVRCVCVRTAAARRQVNKRALARK